jgi:hypothetical protein
MGSAAMPTLAEFKNLETLEMWFATITDDDLAQLAGMTKLKELNLEQCSGITNAGMANLLKIPSIQILNLKQTKIDDAALEELAKMPNLVDLNIANTAVTDAGVEKFKAAKPKCEVKY